MSPVKHQNISAFILAGGGSRRFGTNTNKALAIWQGEPLISHIGKVLAGCFESVSIVAKRDTSYRSFGYPVVEDVFSGQSPLVGIYSGLWHSRTDWNFFTACDMPFLTSGIIDQLTDVVEDTGDSAEIILPVSSHGLEPLAGLYHRSLVSTIDHPDFSNIALRTFIRSRKYITVEFESTKPFTNVNTQEEFARIDR